MDIDAYHKYLSFMAGEAAKVMTDPSDDEVIRLSTEFNAFKERCATSDLPAEVKQEIAKVKVDYTSAATSKSTWMIYAGVLTFGVAALIFYYRRLGERRELVQGLKSHLDALSMRTRLRY